MNGNTADIVTDDFAFAGMESGTHFQPQRADLVGNDAGAQHAARRAVKGGEYTIAGRLDLTAAIAREVAADRGVMIVEKIAPAAVAQLSSLLGRADDAKRTVANTRSAGTTARELVRNSRMASAISVTLSPTNGMWSIPANSRWRAPQICSAK